MENKTLKDDLLLNSTLNKTLEKEINNKNLFYISLLAIIILISVLLFIILFLYNIIRCYLIRKKRFKELKEEKVIIEFM